MDNSPAAAFIKDERGTMHYVSASFERALGIPRERCVGRGDGELWPEQAAALHENDLAVLRSGRTMEFIERLPDGSGNVREWLSFKFPMASPGDRPRLLGGIALDVTERRAAEQAQARLAAIVEGSDDAIMSVDLAGSIISWNGGAERLFGYTAADVLGKSLSLLCPPELGEEWRSNLAGVCGGTRVRQFETVRVTKDGRHVHVSISTSPVHDADGAVVGAAGILRDIGDRKGFETALAESERFARSTVDALTDHIAIIDECGEILAVNRAWREYAIGNELGCPSFGLGRNYLAACDAAGAEGAAAAQGIRSVLRGDRDRFDLEYACHSPLEQRWFVMRVTRFIGEGSVRLVICHENVTARKRAEALQREQSAMRGAVAAMEQVLGVVGHELRTPLAGLRAMSEFLLTDGAGGTEDGRNFLASINEEVIRMADTVDEILEAARLNSGRAKWNWSSFELAESCEDALDTVRSLVDESRVRVTYGIDPRDLRMLGDAAAIRRLVLNLAGNSRKHTADGEIRVTATQFDDADGQWIELRVADTGVGIPPEIVSRLGEAFALNSGIVGANHVSGTGLGLAICKGIAAAHGGTIAVESTVGAGTTMTVRLRADLPGPATGGGKNVIVTPAPAAAAASLLQEVRA